MKGRPLLVPKSASFRPTMDRVRESVANILMQYVDWDSASVCDLFAGSGACGLEMMSRGAPTCIFVENSRANLQVLEHNIRNFGLEAQCSVLNTSVDRYLSTVKDTCYSVIFADPPYKSVQPGPLLDRILERNLLDKEGVVIWEHAASEDVTISEMWSIIECRKYGDTGIVMLQIRGQHESTIQ